MQLLNKILLSLTSFIFLSTAYAANTPIQSGIYGDLMLGYDPSSQQITGFYQSFTGDQQQFSCVFYFKGKLEGKSAKIESEYPGDTSDKIDGTLTFTSDKDFTIKLKKEHGGCWNVQHFADTDQPATFTIQAPYPWKNIRIIKSDKAYFYKTPNLANKQKAYLVKNNSVGIINKNKGWLEVNYLGDNGKFFSGWILSTDFY